MHHSHSPKNLLATAGIFADEIIAPDIDETSFKNERPAHYVLRMAEKANTVASQQCGHFILSADTAVTCGRQILQRLKL